MSILCSRRSTPVSASRLISSRRRRYPDRACASLSIAWRLTSSSRSSCVCTPSSVACVGCVSCRYESRSSTKWDRGSEAIIVSAHMSGLYRTSWLHQHRSVNGTINAPLHMPGTLFVVATPIGNLEDITVRALRVLGEVAVIAAEDTRRTAHLLARHAISTPTTSLHEHNESKKTPALIARLQNGEDVALVSDAGTPTISDPGSHLIRQTIDAGLTVVPIPGPSAAMAALAVSGFPTGTFAFLGFPPVRAKDRIEWFKRLKSIGGTVVFFEAPHRI